MQRLYILFTTILFSLLCGDALGQTVVTGTVKDSLGAPILGAAVVETGTSNGIITDERGEFSLTISDPATAKLTATFTGLEPKTVAVAGRSVVNIVLKPDEAEIDQVMIIGYGTSNKKQVTGANAKVAGEKLERLNVPRMDQALQGQVAGVTINTNSGSPGGSSSIRIRGLSTFGDNDPLILVDGIVYDSEGLNALNPNDIESVTVLKDATAGIYGVRAANGVIIIKTKKGSKRSKPVFTVNAFYGVQQTARKLPLLNATEYAVIKNETFANGGDDLPFNNTNLGVGTNWQDSVFTTAPMASYNIGVSGGNESTTYSIGGSYYTQDGIVGGEKANFTRWNSRVNLETDLSDKLTLTSVFLYTREERDVLPENGIGSVLYNTINAFPTEPIRTPDGRYSYLDEVSDIINPIAQMENTYNTSWVNKFVGKEELAWEINDHITWSNRVNYNYAIVDTKVFSPLVWYGPGKAQNTAVNEDLDPSEVEIAPGTTIERGASVFEQRATYSDFNVESFANYKKVFNEMHSVKATAGISVFARNGQAVGGTAYNIPNNSYEYADISANQAPGGFLNNTSSFQFQERLLSQFVRAQYQYDTKYNAALILRRDGSSRFGPNNRYGYFPTISGSWLISDESFYQLNRVSFAKLRMSYGVSGNDQIPNFAYRGLLDGEGVYVFDDVITNGVAIGRAGNPDLKWETTRQFNVGLDAEVLGQLDVTINYFIKNTRDLLFQPDVSALLGAGGAGGFAPVINAGDVSNRGLELELGYSTKEKRQLQFTGNLNGTWLRNEVTAVPDGVDFLPGAGFGVGGNVATRFEAGFPIGYFFGYETDGVFQTQEEIENSPVVQEGAKPGDLRYVDQNGDGVINFSDDSDKKQIGSPIPKYTLGFNWTLNYKGFDLAGHMYAALGQQIIRNFERQQPFANQMDYVINRWTGPGSTDENPRLTTDLNRNTVFSDYYVENGSFLRMRNLQLGYTFPAKWMSKFNVSNARIYVAANNLFTITGYRGYDPDVGAAFGPLSAGVDYGFYPQARTIMGGISLRF